MKSFEIPVLLFTLLVVARFVEGQKYDKDNLPRLPAAELLVEGYLPERFLLTTKERTLVVQQDEIGLGPSPSVSADGNLVASARRRPGDSSRAPRRILSVYSVNEEKWTDFPDFEGVEGSVAISPDGSRVACVTRDRQSRIMDLPHFHFRVLDRRTGHVSELLDSGDSPMGLTWSPDGRRIAFDMEPPHRQSGSRVRQVYIAGIDTGKIQQVGTGLSPAWSPSGEWIAYVSYVTYPERQQDPRSDVRRNYLINDFRISLMSNIGTSSRVLMSFHSDVNPTLQPVWSPDSRVLLINQSRNPDNDTFDVYMLDIITGKRVKTFRNVGPVYAWITAG